MPDFDFIKQYFDFFGLTWGVLIIIGVGILIFLLVAIILEHRTKLIFPNRPDSDDDDDFEFDFGFGDDDEDEDKDDNSSKDADKGIDKKAKSKNV